VNTIARKVNMQTTYSISPKERLSVWQKARGMWKNKRPNPIKVLGTMRKEWNKTLP
jgi:hypothetical protein